MKNALRRIRSDHSSDAGLTLVEVIAAVIVVVTVALASAGLSINGIQTATAQQRQQVAVTIANGAMENVSGWNVGISSSSNVSSLYTGRQQTPVANAFANFPTVPGVSETYPTYDPIAPTAPDNLVAIPISGTSVENGTSYTTTTLIGDCYEPVAGGTCGKITGQTTEPATTPAGYSQVIRIIVIVSWSAGSSCTTNGCYYEATTMEDPHADLQWVST
jgi:Tfp pilus assembly protein PilV